MFAPKRKDPAMCDRVLRRHDRIPGFRNMTRFLYSTYHKQFGKALGKGVPLCHV